jgi:hypothetical protein
MHWILSRQTETIGCIGIGALLGALAYRGIVGKEG